ncbi:hypothetical protein ACLKA7_001274 [Drosophila subpalustris]
MKPGSGTGYPPWCSAGQPNYNKLNYRTRQLATSVVFHSSISTPEPLIAKPCASVGYTTHHSFRSSPRSFRFLTTRGAEWIVRIPRLWPQEAAASPTERELLREMDDLLEGWEPELDEMLGEVAATLEPLIQILSAPTIQLLQTEVSRLGGEYHRSRFRVVDGEILYTVTINAAGAVMVTLCEKGGGGVRRR